MGRQSRSDGIAETIAFFEALPEAAREELADTLSALGGDAQKFMQGKAPKRTGRLRRGISWISIVQGLRVRIGLLGMSGESPYYGRFVNFGRRAQTVVVQRRRRVRRTYSNGASFNLLRLRRRRKIAEDIVATYTLHVRARAPVPFVVFDTGFEARADSSFADFWGRVLTRSGGVE